MDGLSVLTNKYKEGLSYNCKEITGSLKENAGIIKTYHSNIVKHIQTIEVSKCGDESSFGYAQRMTGSEQR